MVTFAGSSDADPERERELVEGVLGRRVDGLILVPTAHDHTYLQRDVAAGIGLVFVDRPPETIDADHVLTDNRGGARAAVEHLLAHGHERIAFVGPAPNGLYTAAERLAGYLRGGGGAAASCTATSSRCSPGRTGRPRCSRAQNLVTIEVLRTLHRLGLQDQIAHVGFDDIVLAGSIEPALTVVAQDALGLGRAAAELLFSRLDGFTGRARAGRAARRRVIERGSGELQASS